MLSNRQLFIIFSEFIEHGANLDLSTKQISENLIFWMKRRYPEYEDTDKPRVTYMILLMDKPITNFINQT